MVGFQAGSEPRFGSNQPGMITIMLMALAIVGADFCDGTGERNYGISRSLRLTLILKITYAFSSPYVRSPWTQVREMTDYISKAQGEELRSTWVQAMPWFFYVHRSFSAVVLLANLWMGWLLYRSLGFDHSLTRLALGMIVVVSVAIASGATLGHLGMPAFVQPTHLLASALLFGLQFLIWMSYRHAKNAKTSGELAAA